MPTAFLYNSDDDRHRDVVDRNGRFTDVLPSAPKVESRQIALVSFDGEGIDAVALMTRGNKAANYKWHITFSHILDLDPPLDFDDLKRQLSSPLAKVLTSSQRRKGTQLSDREWVVLRSTLSSIRPDLDLSELERRAARRRLRTGSPDREPIVAYEHDAVGLALSLAGIDRRPILESWSGSEKAPFLRGLSEFNLLEDRMIEHDAGIFGAWGQIRRGAIGIAEFRDRDRRVTILNVNRAGVEHALGVDLVYYNHEFDAYVVVQYKRMLPRDDEGGYEFRPDGQLRKEIARMRKLTKPADPPTTPKEFRLDDVGAYLKLCPSTAREAFTHELIRGMYLPLSYWDLLVASPQALGPKGGVAVSFDNADRHLNNTTFIELVSSSWIGSRGMNSAQITRIVRESLATRSLILAEARSVH